MTRNIALAAVAALLTTLPAAAQDRPNRPGIILTPENPSRWDMSLHIGWLGAAAPGGIPTYSDDRYEAAAFGGSLGFYATRHLKIELDVSTSTKAHLYSYEPIVIPGERYPFVLPQEHEFQRTSAALGVTYQFFENAWFHPFVAAGADASSSLRPFAAAGFKWYVTERAFIRSDLRSSFSPEHADVIIWRTGVGFDF